MFMTIGYIALLAYAGGLFIWTVSQRRELAAVGILMSVAGLQLAFLETVSPALGSAIALAGLAAVGRDVMLAVTGRSTRLAVARAQTDGGTQ